MISSKKYVDETLKKHHLVANKALGQNFLIESDIALEIVNSASIDNNTCVIEIGPGLGALTEILVEKAKHVFAYEIDLNMVNILKDTFKDHQNITIYHQDFQKVDLAKLVSDISCERLVLISNLPYYITSKLLNMILLNDLKIDTIITMMQKEVGLKIVKPDKKQYNTLSVVLDYQYEVNVVKYVGKNSYLPRPEIDSIVLKFKKINPKYDVDFSLLLNVTNAIFKARRKTISNNLKGFFKDNEQEEAFFKKVNLAPTLHVEQLSFIDFINISKALKK